MRGRRQFTAIASRYRDISRSVCRAPDSLAVQDRWLSRVSPMPHLGAGIGPWREPRVPHGEPRCLFAGAGRLIAHVVLHIQIVSEGFPLPTGRMHANPTRQYISQLRESLSTGPRLAAAERAIQCLTARLLGCNASDACDTPALFSTCRSKRSLLAAAIETAKRHETDNPYIG